jgi:hypothetical protein
VAEFLGVGGTHYPGFIGTADRMADQFLRSLDNERTPAAIKDPANWPEGLKQELADDRGAATGARHREQVIGAMMRTRDAIDAFRPDVVIMAGDDQFENFHEDLVPVFSVCAYDAFEVQPFARRGGGVFGGGNIWEEPSDKVFRFRGQPEIARKLTSGVIRQGFDLAYAYKPLHAPSLSYSFSNTLLYLDDDRRGWHYPVVPIYVNCHGDLFVRNHAHGGPVNEEAPPDPEAPSPRRCFEFGEAAARALRETDLRVAFIGSASWSHGSLNTKSAWTWPDVEADRRTFEHLRDGDLTYFRDVTSEQLAEAGQRELRLWCFMLGAMHEVGAKVEDAELFESWAFNSVKAVALLRP